MERKYDISFFFPAFNDEGTIEEMVIEARSVLKEVARNYEIIIVNDGSVDSTRSIADKMAGLYDEVKVIHHLYNIGYGGALKTGFAVSKYDYIFYTDGDHQFDINDLHSFVPYLKEYDLISGYRLNRAYEKAWLRKMTSNLYNLFIRIFLGIKWKDVDCAFKLINKDIVKKAYAFVNSAFICSEIFFQANKTNKKILQLPVKHYPRKHGVSSSFSLFFILRSIIELFEALWELRYKDTFYKYRQKKLLKLELKKHKKGSNPEK